MWLAVWVLASSGVNVGIIVRVACHVGRRFEVSRMVVSRDVCFRHQFSRASCGWWFDVGYTFCMESEAVAPTAWCCAIQGKREVFASRTSSLFCDNSPCSIFNSKPASLINPVVFFYSQLKYMSDSNIARCHRRSHRGTNNEEINV
ncbi:hypothetical protein BKA58DRAFT_14454 [Alternaria rosae]|uniref:uncharacterized protein n=1 Tax=Alternaria rosae TaxID=1187941 RepID=UPI001E8E3A93|nr:uncharacterized protein BKA58DRAFT_14454 [Alternaria rosae]KAH6882163.1 hypothetical protein BKA58DRAFT_14454 [Alternaria rosae]